MQALLKLKSHSWQKALSLQLGMEGNFPNLKKLKTYSKPHPYWSILSNIRMRQGFPPSPLLFSIVWKVLANAIKWDKGRRIIMGQGDIKLLKSVRIILVSVSLKPCFRSVRKSFWFYKKYPKSDHDLWLPLLFPGLTHPYLSLGL